MRIKRLLFLASCCATSASAYVLIVGADKDTTIFQSDPSGSAGAGPGIFAGTNGNTSPRRGLISFSLSGIPRGSIITDVQLTLTIGQVAGSNGSGGNTVPRMIELHALTRDWAEGTTGSAATAIDQTGMGFPANVGDATWNAAFYSPSAPTVWTKAGGDFIAAPSVSLTLPSATVGAAYTWSATAPSPRGCSGLAGYPGHQFRMGDHQCR